MAAIFQEEGGAVSTDLETGLTKHAEMTAGGLSFAQAEIEAVSGPRDVSGERPTILHFIYGVAGGGAETMMRSLVRGLDRRRWRVVVVAMQAEAWPDEADELRTTADALHLLDETSLMSHGALKKLSAVMRAERPDVVQTWMHHADFIGGLVAHFSGVKRVVWGIHCREITRAPGESWLKAWAFARLISLMSKWVPNRIVSCSHAALEDHVKMGYPRGKLAWIPNGVDTQRFRPLASAREDTRERMGWAKDDFVIGFVGRAHEMKNLPLLLRAFGRLSSREPSARLVLCGVEFEDLDEVSRAQANALSDPNLVTWIPFQSDPELFYPALDVFTLSSRTEACPMTILEAMSCGVTCITTDVGDCAHLIGKTGTVVPAGEVEELVVAWTDWMKCREEKGESLRRATRERVMTTFSLGRVVAGYQNLYETLIWQAKA